MSPRFALAVAGVRRPRLAASTPLVELARRK